MRENSLPVRDVAPQHRFDAERLGSFLRDGIEEFGGNLVVQQFQGGASNPTFLLTTEGARRYVLRKKPPGQLLSSAHQVDREVRVMKALEGSGVPVRRMPLLHEDVAVTGTAFSAMDFLEPRTLRDARLRGLSPVEGSQ